MAGRLKTIRQLQAEIRVKERRLAALYVRKNKFAARLAVIDREISALTGGAVASGKPGAKRVLKGARRGRRPSGKSLTAYLQGVLAKATRGLRAKDAAKAVLDAGYKTQSKAFYGIVAAALRDKKKFKRIRRGVYTLATTAKAKKAVKAKKSAKAKKSTRAKKSRARKSVKAKAKAS